MSNAANASDASPKKAHLTTTQIILIVGFVLVIAAVFTVYLLHRQSTIAETRTPTGNLVVNEDNLESITAEIAEKVEKGTFQTHMNVNWRFPSGDKPSSNAVIGNAEANRYPFYFIVTLANSGETVYTSDLIPVGMTLKELILDKALPAGEYNANCTYILVDENGEEYGGDLSFAVRLLVQS
jgi:hypothetical protein